MYSTGRVPGHAQVVLRGTKGRDVVGIIRRVCVTFWSALARPTATGMYATVGDNQKNRLVNASLPACPPVPVRTGMT